MATFTKKKFELFFHKLHCILRNNDTGLTGMSALNEINNFILLIFIEPKLEYLYNNTDKPLKDEYKFTYLCKFINENKDKLTEHDTETLDELQTLFTNLILSYCSNSNISKYITTEANRLSVFYKRTGLTTNEEKDKAYSFKVCLFNMLNDCKTFIYGDNDLSNEHVKSILQNINTDILGDAYERFKEIQASNAGKEAGQYFTPRIVIKYCIDTLIKPKYNETCYDSSTGTGGFIHYLNKYISLNYNKDELRNFNNGCIYANDKTEELMKPLYINMLLHDINISNIKNRNSLGVDNCKENIEKHNVIVGNPPYGVKVDMKYSKYNNINDNIKNYWPDFIKSGKDKTIKDSMGLFMIHTINSLKKGGRFALIIDRGILNNGCEKNTWQKKLRKYILETCNLEKIILLPKGIFTHTDFDTAIIYGIKTYSITETINKPGTKAVKYYISNFDDVKNKKGFIVKDTPDLETKIETIVNKDWSLKYDDYVEKAETSYEGIEYKTLGEVCEFYPTTKHKTSIGKNKGLYRFYSSSMDNKLYLDTFEIDKESVILGNGGMFNIHYDIKFTPSKHVTVLNIKNDYNIKYKFMYYYYFINRNDIVNMFNGGGLKWLNRTNISKLKIPILPEDHQKEIVEFLDKCTNNDYTILNRLVTEFKDIDLFKFLLIKDYDTFELAIVYIRKLIDYETLYSKQITLMKKGLFKTLQNCETKTLGKVCEIQKGNYNTKDIANTGNIPYYNSGGKNPVSFHNNYTIDYPEYLIFVKDGGDKNNKYNMNSGMAKVYYINGKSAVISHNLILKTKNIIKCKFLYNYLCSTRKDIMKLAKYNSGLGHITKTQYENIKIPVPSIEEQERIVKEIEELDKQDSFYKKGIDSMKQMITTIHTSINTIVNS